jgi:hypothetical protein
MKETLKMSIKEAERLGTMRQIDRKKLTLARASEEMGLCLRQTKRVRKRYLEQGERGLISLKRGRESNRKIDEGVRDRAIKLIKEKLDDFGPTLAREKLEEYEGIKVSDETVRKWLIEEGLWKIKKKKEVKMHQRRERRRRFGELLQGDGSPHDWFEGRSEKCVLIQFVDDATSKTTAARFVKTETTDGYLDLLKDHLGKYGRPLGLYVDKHSVFRVNREEIKTGVGITHFGQVAKELGIDLICANSPQAKGRVERKNGVFQDRLIKEMRLRGINNMEEANRFLSEFLEIINEKFGKEAASTEDAHRKMRMRDNLERIFARKETRKLSKNLTFQYKGTLYMLQTKAPHRLRHATVDVLWSEGEEIKVEYKGKAIEYKKWNEIIYEQPRILDSKELEGISWATKRHSKPRRNHPWR